MAKKVRLRGLKTILLCVMILSSHQTAAADTRHLAVKAGVLIDGTGSLPVNDAVIVISKGLIVDIGPENKVKIPADSKIIDVNEGTILPGFINAHVHKAYDEKLLQAWAQAGITTVRDLAAYPPKSSFDHRDRLNKNVRNARLVAAGPQMTGGFVPSGYPSPVFVKTARKARAEADRILKEGADQLKIMLESNWRNHVMSKKVARAIVETAHKRDKKVSAHISLARDIETAIKFGVDDLAHMALNRVPDKLLKKIVEADIYWTPTIEVWKGFAAKGLISDRYLLDNLGRFVKAGGKVALGTDYNGGPFQFEMGMPIKEIFWMHDAGMSPSDIIIASTKNAAEVCGLGKLLGTLERGKIADILVVDENPLEDLANLKKVRLVIKDGVIIRE